MHLKITLCIYKTDTQELSQPCRHAQAHTHANGHALACTLTSRCTHNIKQSQLFTYLKKTLEQA